MPGSVGQLAVRRGRRVLAATLVAVVVMVGGLGGGMLGHLAGGGFSDPNTQSDRGSTRLEEILDAGDPTCWWSSPPRQARSTTLSWRLQGPRSLRNSRSNPRSSRRPAPGPSGRRPASAATT